MGNTMRNVAVSFCFFVVLFSSGATAQDKKEERKAELKPAIRSTLEGSTWVVKAEVSAATFLRAAGNDPALKKKVEEFIGKKEWIPMPKDGKVVFSAKDGKFVMTHTQPPQGPQQRQVTKLKAEGLKIEFYAVGGDEPNHWKLEFLEKEGKVISAAGLLKNSKLEARVTLLPAKDGDKK